MRVKQAGVPTSSRNRRPLQHSLCMEDSFRAGRGNDCCRDAGLAGSRMRESSSGSYSLVRHNSAVFDHDFESNRSSLVHTVSEVREEMQLGLPHGSKDHMKSDGCGSDGKSGQNNSKGGLVRQVSRESHEFSQETYSSSSTPGKNGHINSFVLKNYLLHDRRTLSLPVGKEYSISQYVGQSTEVQTHVDSDNNSKNVTYSERHTSVSSSSSCDDGDGCCVHDFDIEAERHSKSTLFFEAGFTLLTVMGAMFTLYLCIRFLTSATSNHPKDEPRLFRNNSGVLHDSSKDVGSHCRLFVKACPLLGLLTAGFVLLLGTWASGGRFWRVSPMQTSSSCHCEEYDENRRHVEEADERVRQADRSKQQFMAYVFHNIRVPFNAIVLGLGHMRALGDGGGLLGSAADKMDLVQMMLDCAETMTSVLDDVTDMGQWEGGEMELHKEEFDILAVIKFLSWGLKDLLEQKDIVFNMNIDSVASELLTSHRVVGDKQRVVQTLGNFLSNAVKFTPSGGRLDLDLQCEEVVGNTSFEDHIAHPNPSPQTSEGPLLGAAGIQILSKTSSQIKTGEGKVAKLRLSVKDNGIGISAQDQAKLFEPYSFVTSGWVLKAGVSGLGLSMAKRFVERAGGNIGVESEEGSGSTFFFSLPFPLVAVDVSNEREQVKSDGGAPVLQKSEVTQSMDSSGVTVVHESITLSRRRSNLKEDLKPAVKTKMTNKVPNENVNSDISDSCAKKSKHDGLDGRQRKILLVEDTRINRIILRKVLQNLNLLCDEAENGQIAIDFHKQGRTYDLVLMDKEMPVMDGHEATRQLRNMGVKTPIVALTGNALTTDREMFFEAGVDDFQTKPLSRDKLVQLLARYGVENSSSKSSYSSKMV
ncbi:uncharacterized protein [Physcomitrium patens]|uniref:histidine kinase n=1 Tax=Physcomitrium patens TaxID=3218 RepID=A0A2K1LAM6_PHYPA|nr:uncharacterized protein LOC112280388 [Physcomitrium patens]PNR63079.1 hypothetical protein PHYPA_001504 [Physcomitrium patens]|eukprot:XP_024371609.1 uncharacterized protein LOC112280388 [Physcomitrella patens]